MPSPTTAPAGPGRPRRYETAEELQLLFDAAFEVMRQKGYQDVTVGDILAAAGVSTRSFYRHFASKEELLAAMFGRDAEQFAAAIARRVDAAPTPRAAVVVWIDEILGFGLGRGRARRAAVLGSPAAMRALPADVLARAGLLLTAPLIGALTAGCADGTIPTVDADRDAASISAIAWDASARLRDNKSRREQERIRECAIAFVERALGITT
ncbi:MAG TPA: TetR/AcrR family transcriptional regulator [Acidimicrobiales bacterium]